MNRELVLQELLQAVYEQGTLPLYDFIASHWPGDEEVFLKAKCLGDELVEEKLAHYSDGQRSVLTITNFGRFWVMKGGYEAYLREGEHKQHKEHHHEHPHKPENQNEHDLKDDLREARLRYTRYRIITFWWGFGISLISFALSLLSIFLILTRNK